jgi:hypothetical protein
MKHRRSNVRIGDARHERIGTCKVIGNRKAALSHVEEHPLLLRQQTSTVDSRERSADRVDCAWCEIDKPVRVRKLFAHRGDHGKRCSAGIDSIANETDQVVREARATYVAAEFDTKTTWVGPLRAPRRIDEPRNEGAGRPFRRRAVKRVDEEIACRDVISELSPNRRVAYPAREQQSRGLDGRRSKYDTPRTSGEVSASHHHGIDPRRAPCFDLESSDESSDGSGARCNVNSGPDTAAVERSSGGLDPHTEALTEANKARGQWIPAHMEPALDLFIVRTERPGGIRPAAMFERMLGESM